MKGIVVEVKNKYSAVLKEDGTFSRVKGIYQIGETIELNDEEVSLKTLRFRKAAGIAAGAAIAATVIIGILGYRSVKVQAYSYVTVGAESGIEYTLNRMDEVIGVRALNEEAESIVSELEKADIINMPVDEALEKTGEFMVQEAGGGQETFSGFEISVKGGDKEAFERLSRKTEKIMDEHGFRTDKSTEEKTEETGQNKAEEKTDAAGELQKNDEISPEQISGGKNHETGEEILDEGEKGPQEAGNMQQPDGTSDFEYDGNAPQDIPDGYAGGLGGPEINEESEPGQ